MVIYNISVKTFVEKKVFVSKVCFINQNQMSTNEEYLTEFLSNEILNRIGSQNDSLINMIKGRTIRYPGVKKLGRIWVSSES